MDFCYITCAINFFYFKYYIFSSSQPNISKNSFIIISFILLLLFLIISTWIPKLITYIGIYSLITFGVNVMTSVFCLILLFMHDKHYLNISGIIIILCIIAVISSLAFSLLLLKNIDKTILLQLSASTTLILIISLPLIFTIIRSKTLALIVGGFIVFMIHFFLSQLLPYFFSYIHAHSGSVELTYELSSTGKIMVGVTDLMFALISLAYNLTMYLDKRIIQVTIKYDNTLSSKVIKDIKAIYGSTANPFKSTEQITYWPGNTTSDFITRFIGTFDIETITTLFIFWGIYRSIKKGKFSSLVKKSDLNYKNHHKRID